MFQSKIQIFNFELRHDGIRSAIFYTPTRNFNLAKLENCLLTQKNNLLFDFNRFAYCNMQNVAKSNDRKDCATAENKDFIENEIWWMKSTGRLFGINE